MCFWKFFVQQSKINMQKAPYDSVVSVHIDVQANVCANLCNNFHLGVMKSGRYDKRYVLMSFRG